MRERNPSITAFLTAAEGASGIEDENFSPKGTSWLITVSRTDGARSQKMFFVCSNIETADRQAGSDKERTSSAPSSNRNTQCENFENA